jgi:gluconate 2-dehydrogenase
MNKPKLLVARRIFDETLLALRAHFEVEDNPVDTVFSPEELARRLHHRQRAHRCQAAGRMPAVEDGGHHVRGLQQH